MCVRCTAVIKQARRDPMALAKALHYGLDNFRTLTQGGTVRMDRKDWDHVLLLKALGMFALDKPEGGETSALAKLLMPTVAIIMAPFLGAVERFQEGIESVDVRLDPTKVTIPFEGTSALDLVLLTMALSITDNPEPA